MGVLSKEYHPSQKAHEANAVKTIVGKAAQRIKMLCRDLFIQAFLQAFPDDGDAVTKANGAYEEFHASLSPLSKTQPIHTIPDIVKAYCQSILDSRYGLVCGYCKEPFAPDPTGRTFIKVYEGVEIRYCSALCFTEANGQARGRKLPTPDGATDATPYERSQLSDERLDSGSQHIEDLFDS